MSDVNDSDGEVAESDDTAADRTSSFMREYRKVPELGKAWRWYDLVYRPTAFLVDRSPLKKIRAARVLRVRMFNALNRYRDLESFRQWSRQDRNQNLCLAAGENVHLNDIWVAEFFPPSQLPRLQETYRRQGWDRARLRMGLHGDNLKSLSESRATGRWRWWKTATVVDRKSAGFMPPEFTRADLPEELQMIELQTVALGPALTAVVARFRLSSTGRSALNSAWHGPHEPRILRQPGRQARAMNRQEVAFRDTGAVRADLHSTARRWLSDNCPGIFSNSGAAQPLLDLLLLDKYDPDTSEHPTPEARDSLRALGLKDHSWSRLTSQNLPGFILEQMDEDPMVEAFAGTATWSLWGNTTSCVNEAGDLEMYHYDSPVEALGSRYQDEALATLLDLGLWELVLLLRRQNAAARDAAAARHDQFRRKDALALRRNFLRTSIDTVSIAREVRSYVESRWWGAGFVYTPAARDGERYPSGKSFDEQLRKTLKAETDDVTAFDSDYRTIMTAAATLGNAAAALLTSRVALIVSGSSLGVAAINLLLSHCTGDPTPAVPVPTPTP